MLDLNVFFFVNYFKFSSWIIYLQTFLIVNRNERYMKERNSRIIKLRKLPWNTHNFALYYNAVIIVDRRRPNPKRIAYADISPSCYEQRMYLHITIVIIQPLSTHTPYMIIDFYMTFIVYTTKILHMIL